MTRRDWLRAYGPAMAGLVLVTWLVLAAALR
jgi:hypothetical protein